MHAKKTGCQDLASVEIIIMVYGAEDPSWPVLWISRNRLKTQAALQEISEICCFGVQTDKDRCK